MKNHPLIERLLKRQPLLRRTSCLGALLLLAGLPAPAATLTWDANSGTAGLQDGSGNWDTTSALWWDGTSNVTWTNADANSAVFGSGAAGGTIAVGAGTHVANLTLNTNYIFSGNTLILTNSGIITAAAGSSNLIGSYFGGSVGWTLEGGGVINHNIGGNDTYSGPVFLNNGTVWVGGNDSRQYFTGDVNVNPNGALKYTSGGSTGGILGGSKTLIINGGLVASGTASSKYLNVNKLVLENNGLFRNNPGFLMRTTVTNVDGRSGFLGQTDNRYTAPALAKSTAGTVIVTNRPYGAGMGYIATINAGTVLVDKTMDKTANKIFSALTLAGGSLVYSNGAGAVAGAEGAITSTTAKAGASGVRLLTAEGMTGSTVALTAITRQTGGTLDLATNNSGNAITTTTANNNGILGGWATYNATDWAAGSPIAPLASYQADLNPANWTATDNVTLNASPSANVGTGATVNSLRLTDAATVTLDGTFTLSSGGLLVTGSGATAITGGTLLGASGADLIVQQNAAADLTVTSTLADNGSATALTKSGSGKLVLNPAANNMTGANYLNAGTVEVSSLAALASGPVVMAGGALRYTGATATESRALTLNSLGGTFDVSEAATTLTLSGNLGNSDGVPMVNIASQLMGNLGGLTKTGNGTLVLEGSNQINGLTLVSAGTLLVNGTNTADAGSFNAGQVAVTGGVLGGTGRLAGSVTVQSGGTIAPGTSLGTLTIGTSLTMAAGSTGLFEVTNAPGAGDLLVVQSNLTVASGSVITISVTGTPLNAGTYTLIQYAGKKAGSFNTVPVLAAGSINGSYSISDSTPGQINLVVVPNVTITGEPSDLIVSTNDPASFSVVATGEAPINYQWYAYGTSGNTPTLLTDETNTTFALASAQGTDSGYYAVVAANSFNSVTSRLALLTVGNVLPLLAGPTNVTVIAGNNYTFNTRVVIANPQPAFQWQTNGADVAGATTTSLTFNNVQYAQDGTAVSVIASNIVGLVTNSAVLTVIVTPSITLQPTNQLVNAGSLVTIDSGASGVPAPTLQWYKNGAIIPDATNSTYTIASAQGSDIGTYYLVAANAAGTNQSSSARLTVNSTTLATAALAPADDATGVCYDTLLKVTFNGPVSIINSGKIRIYNAASPATPVDTIDMASNVVSVTTLNAAAGAYLTNNIQSRTLFPGDSQAFNHFPVIIAGNTATIYPHPGVLTSNQTYYVTLENGIFADANGAWFAGISDVNTWTFTTKPTGPADTNNVVVAADGSGDFATVQGAVDSIPLGNTSLRILNIRDGNYVELVNISGKHNLTLRGQSRTGTVISYANNANITPGGTTHGRMSFKVSGNDIKVERLTLANTTPQGGSQAEALMIESGAARFVMFDCDVTSLQDTILANINSSQGYFLQSTIKGNYDYVWGGGNLFFTNCVIHTVSNLYVTNNYNFAAARTDFSATSNTTTHWLNPAGSYSANGFSFVNCALQTDPTVTTVTLEGANGTANGLVAFVGCSVDTNHYVTPSAAILSSYVLWEYANSNLDGTFPVNLGLTVLPDSDPRLLAAQNATTWLYGWLPTLAPNILTNPASLTVNAGDSATFSVSATGLPVPTYQWLKNGNPIADATNATLVIAVAHVADAANYSVVVTTPAGSATSTAATLTVTPHANTAAPAFTAPADGTLYTINAGVNLSVTNTATDADMPAETIAFSLLSGSGSLTAEGIYTWRPEVTAAGTTNVVMVVATDDGAPTLSATNTFSVVVNPLTPWSITSSTYENGQFGLTVNGQAGPDYAVQVTTNLASPVWVTLFTTNSPAVPFTFVDPNAGAVPMQFYRVVVGPPLP